jgi:regulator of protease activity HflC (stomatin/prohibitin superfamily)
MFTSCLTNVRPTEAGFLINNSGDYRGIDSLPLLVGYNFSGWNSTIVKIPTTVQHEVWTDAANEGQDGAQAIQIACMGGASMRVDVGLNYQVDPKRAAHIYLKWKDGDLSDLTNKFIKNVVRGSMQDISGTITMDSILNNLPGFEHESQKLIEKRLGVDGFVNVQFNIVSAPRPTDSNISTQINLKIAAKQKAERAVMELQSSIAEANKDVAKARGDSASKVINAAGEAEAVRKIQSVLSSTYVDYIKATRWNGVLPIYSGNGSTMLNFGPLQSK